MDSNLTGRVNLYDILAMVLPGGVWLLCIITIVNNYCPCIDARNWSWVQTLNNAEPEVSVGLCMGLLIFVLAYLIGLMQDSIIHGIRNLYKDQMYLTISWVISCLIKKAEKKEDIERKGHLQNIKDNYNDVRAKALETDQYNNTILTIEFQCAMVRGLLLPLSILVRLCFSELSCGVIWGLITFAVLFVLLYVRSIRLIKTIIRHYNIAIKKENNSSSQRTK